MVRLVIAALVMALTMGTAGAGEFRPREPKAAASAKAAAKPRAKPQRRLATKAKPKQKKPASKQVAKRPLP